MLKRLPITLGGLGPTKPKENLTFRPSWPSGRPRTAQALPRSSGRPAQGRLRAPRACPGARQDLARPALGRPRPAEELRKACPGPPQGARELPGSSPRAAQELPRSWPRPAQELPGSFRPDTPTLPQDGFSKSRLRSTTQFIVEKASEHAVESASRPPCSSFRPVAAAAKRN